MKLESKKNQDFRYWFNVNTDEVVNCDLHYDCRKIQDMIEKDGKMNFYRNGWCRIACYNQGNRILGIVEGYNHKLLKKGVEFLLSRHKIDTLMAEKHDTNGYDIRIHDIGGSNNGIQ